MNRFEQAIHQAYQDKAIADRMRNYGMIRRGSRDNPQAFLAKQQSTCNLKTDGRAATLVQFVIAQQLMPSVAGQRELRHRLSDNLDEIKHALTLRSSLLTAPADSPRKKSLQQQIATLTKRTQGPAPTLTQQDPNEAMLLQHLADLKRERVFLRQALLSASHRYHQCTQ